ncbi:hypothetical protein PLESTB_001764600 [Pleodorina starrii]|uniref:Uncharacterized protein n=1 Tax=Pleodorina starrii TaxID=330485 RepID=A0A9W6F9L4_9CHLO|nr:hypothetical protein PLESTB_001764600 [Pleodorina starrii]
MRGSPDAFAAKGHASRKWDRTGTGLAVAGLLLDLDVVARALRLLGSQPQAGGEGEEAHEACWRPAAALLCRLFGAWDAVIGSHPCGSLPVTLPESP